MLVGTASLVSESFPQEGAEQGGVESKKTIYVVRCAEFYSSYCQGNKCALSRVIQNRLSAGKGKEGIIKERLRSLLNAVCK